jgi:hypothetical protein
MRLSSRELKAECRGGSVKFKCKRAEVLSDNENAANEAACAQHFEHQRENIPGQSGRVKLDRVRDILKISPRHDQPVRFFDEILFLETFKHQLDGGFV